MSLIKEFEIHNNVVLVLNGEKYKKSMFDLSKQFSLKFKKILFVSASAPIISLLSDFKKNGVNVKNFYFVDCVSKQSNIKEAVENSVSISSPSALTELGIALSKLMKENFELVFFDSVSALLIYNNELSVVKFLHFLMNKIKANNSKALFLVLTGDAEKKLLKDIELFADKITFFDSSQSIKVGKLSKKKA